MPVRCLALTFVLLVCGSMLSQSAPVALLATNGIVGQTRDLQEQYNGEPTDIEADRHLLPDPEVINAVSYRPQPTNTAESTSAASAAAASSLPAVELSAENGANSRPKCGRVPRVKRISLPGCADLYVDIGQCSGACNTRQQPQDRFEIVNGVFKFPVKRSCKCCQTKATEVQALETRCAYPNVAGSSYFRTVRVEVVTKCHCRKCVDVQAPAL